MSGQHSRVLTFGPFELSIANRRLTNGAKLVPPAFPPLGKSPTCQLPILSQSLRLARQILDGPPLAG
jgi:hypothetical protein